MDKPHNISGVFLLRIMVENYSGVDKNAMRFRLKGMENLQTPPHGLQC